MLALDCSTRSRLLPGDAMPEMGLTREQAQSMANYLYTLE